MANRMSVNAAARSIQDLRTHLDDLAGNKRKLAKADIDDPLLHKLAQDLSVSESSDAKVSVRKMRELLGTLEGRVKDADTNGDQKIEYMEAARMSPLMTQILDRADRTNRLPVNDALKTLKQIQARFEDFAAGRKTVSRSSITDPALLVFANYNWVNRSKAPPATVSIRKMGEEITRLERKLNYADMDGNDRIGYVEAGWLGRIGGEFVDLVIAGVGGPELAQAKLDALAASFVSTHSDDAVDYVDGVDPIFPRLNHGENGLMLHTYHGDAGAKLAKFAAAWSRDSQALANFDPEASMLFAVETTGDETSMYVCAMDRVTGESEMLVDINLVDAGYVLGVAAFEAAMGPLSEFGVSDIEDLEQGPLTDALTAGSTLVDIPDPEYLNDMIGARAPFDATEYEGWGNEPDFSIFASAITHSSTVAKDLGTLVVDGHYNPKLYDAGMSRDAVKELYQQIKSSCPDFDAYGEFEISGVRELFDANEVRVGYEVRYSDEGGIIGASAYLNNDNVGTYGLGS